MNAPTYLVLVHMALVPIFQEGLTVVVSWGGRVNIAWRTSMNVKIRIPAAITQFVSTH